MENGRLGQELLHGMGAATDQTEEHRRRQIVGSELTASGPAHRGEEPIAARPKPARSLPQ